MGTNTLANIIVAASFNILYAGLLFIFYVTDNTADLNFALITTLLLFACFALMILFSHRANHQTTQKTTTPPTPEPINKNRSEAALLAKIAFLDTMNHEIRTPLNGIMGMTSLLMGTRQTAEQKKYLETIKLSSEALLKSLTDLVSFSKTKSHISPAPSQTHTPINNTDINLNPEEERILLAEDNPINQLVAQTMLKKLGFKNIDLANNGLEVLKNLEKNSYDLIFMDCEMPEMDGYEATRKIRETNKSIPIVAMTAHTTEDDKALCFNSGMNDYIPKPVDRQALVRTLARWLPQEVTRS